VDDGLEFGHEDLVNNYNANSSWNYVENSPTPLYSGRNAHGTKCAGEIIGAPNGVCGVGVAFGARLSGKIIKAGS